MTVATLARDVPKILPLVYIVGAIVGGFFLWKAIRGLQTGVADAVAPASQALADFVVGTGGVGFADESNAVVLPNGQKTTWDAITRAGGSLKSDNTFVYQGTKYVVTGRGANNAWQTKLA